MGDSAEKGGERRQVKRRVGKAHGAFGRMAPQEIPPAVQTRTHTHTYVCTYKNTHMHIYACTHKNTHTHAHQRVRGQIQDTTPDEGEDEDEDEDEDKTTDFFPSGRKEQRAIVLLLKKETGVLKMGNQAISALNPGIRHLADFLRVEFGPPLPRVPLVKVCHFARIKEVHEGVAHIALVLWQHQPRPASQAEMVQIKEHRRREKLARQGMDEGHSP